MPEYQRWAVWASWLIGGALGLGALLGSFESASALLTPSVSFGLSLLVLALWAAIELGLRFVGVNWRVHGAQTVRLRRLGNQPRLAICGALLLLWTPHLSTLVRDRPPAGPVPSTAAPAKPDAPLPSGSAPSAVVKIDKVDQRSQSGANVAGVSGNVTIHQETVKTQGKK